MGITHDITSRGGHSRVILRTMFKKVYGEIKPNVVKIIKQILTYM